MSRHRTTYHAEEVILGAAIVHGRRVPPAAMLLRIHRDIANALEAACDLEDEIERVEKMADVMRKQGHWGENGTGHASYSNLSKCVLAYDDAGDDVLELAVEYVQDSHRRREMAEAGAQLARDMDAGVDTEKAVARILGALGEPRR